MLRMCIFYDFSQQFKKKPFEILTRNSNIMKNMLSKMSYRSRVYRFCDFSVNEQLVAIKKFKVRAANFFWHNFTLDEKHLKYLGSMSTRQEKPMGNFSSFGGKILSVAKKSSLKKKIIFSNC